jgi:hypothetical protein
MKIEFAFFVKTRIPVPNHVSIQQRIGSEKCAEESGADAMGCSTHGSSVENNGR